MHAIKENEKCNRNCTLNAFTDFNVLIVIVFVAIEIFPGYLHVSCGTRTFIMYSK